MKTLTLSICILLAFSSCGNLSWLPKEETTDNSANTNNSRQTVEKKYYPNGKLYAEVAMKNGKRHGLSKSYYKSGKLHLEMPYVSGLKEGESKMYWESGQVRRVTPYAAGKKHGVRKSYFTNGQLSSSITYENDLPHNDLVEYTQSGNEVSKYPELKYKITDRISQDGTYTVQFYFTNGKKPEFYVGKLANGNVFDESQLQAIPGGENTWNLEKGQYIAKDVPIVALCKSNKSNPVIRTMTFDLSIKRP